MLRHPAANLEIREMIGFEGSIPSLCAMVRIDEWLHRPVPKTGGFEQDSVGSTPTLTANEQPQYVHGIDGFLRFHAAM